MIQNAVPASSVVDKSPKPQVASAVAPPIQLDADISSQLAGYIRGKWREAVQYKQQQILPELLRCDRQVKGEYDPEDLAAIREIGGSDIYMMISDIKHRAASSWIKDVIASAGDRPYDFEPANNPSLPPELIQSISSFVLVEAAPFIQEGQMIHPDAFRERMEEVHDTVMLRLREEAKEAAARMSDLCEDQMKEGGFVQAVDAFIDDFTKYPAAILKGPVIRSRPKLTWGPNYTPLVTNEYVRETSRVSPYDIYPGPGSKGPNDSYLVERHRWESRTLQDLIGLPGYNAGEIAAALSKYGRTGLKYNEAGDAERSELENKASYSFFIDSKIEVLEFWGPVQGMLLKQWGYDGKCEDFKVYEVNAMLVGGHVIRAVMNPDPLGRRPYHVASWRQIADSFWGQSLMYVIRDVQRMCNNAARSLANNMGIASGPQVDVAIDRLPAGYDVTDLYPWKVHQSTSDKTGANQPAVRFYQPDMHADKLMNVYLTFAKQADEVSGIPNYIYGSGNASGAGRTASGLSMLMDNAAKGIKMAIVGVDKSMSGAAHGYYVHNMLFHPDPFVKGDFRLVTRGALGVLVKEQLEIRRREFMVDTNNPVDLQIIGIEGRSYMLRERAKSLEMDTDKIIPSLEMIRFRQREQQRQMAAMAAQGLAPDGLTPLQPQQPAAPAAALPNGAPAGGEQANLMQPRV